jgi:hypothetical protein
VHYGLREGDRVAFIRQHRTADESRVENGSRGEVTHIDERDGVVVTLDGSARQVKLASEDIDALRLGYAPHLYRQQGATVERSIVLTGGWQTSKESSYVQASRAREGTDWHLAREELGTEGTDLDRIERLAEKNGPVGHFCPLRRLWILRLLRQKRLECRRSRHGRGGFRTCDLSRVKRALSH